MNETVKKTTPHTQIHQCLFGYQEGHRLLSSSIQLPDEASSMLLLLSDLAPGLHLPTQGCYWTGVPLPSAKSYALIRTWLAPEMSRPGCVWSHVLIIAFSDIAKFPDLSVLVDYVKRPNTVSEFEIYGKPILITSTSHNSSLNRKTIALNESDAHLVLQSIYSDQASGTVVSPLGMLDNTIFAVWSQQWPHLRRSFSFRTAVNFNNNFSIMNKFDLAIQLGSDRQHQINQFDDKTDCIEGWERICIDDLLHPHSTDFRKFLWRYGSDLTRGRACFKFLANIYLATRSVRLYGNNLCKILTDITNTLPSYDGKVLKEDLVNQNPYSLLPTPDPINLLSFYVTEPTADKLAPLPHAFFYNIRKDWDIRAEEILSIADIAIERETQSGINLLNQLATVIIDRSKFFISTATRPYLCNILLKINPVLMDNDELVNISCADLLRIVDYVPNNDDCLSYNVIRRLIFVNNADLAQKMFSRFPSIVIEHIINAMDSFFVVGGETVPQPWLETISKESSLILRSVNFIANARTTSTLFFIASLLGFAQPETLQVGPIPWAKGLINAHDDLVGSDRQKFLVFLLELALNNPISGCEPLLELAFEQVHTALRYENLSEDETSQLLEYLPELPWFKNWDNCLKLRVKIVDTYTKNNLNPASFRRLTNDPELYEDLVSMANKSEYDFEFSKKIK